MSIKISTGFIVFLLGGWFVGCRPNHPEPLFIPKEYLLQMGCPENPNDNKQAIKVTFLYSDKVREVNEFFIIHGYFPQTIKIENYPWVSYAANYHFDPPSISAMFDHPACFGHCIYKFKKNEWICRYGN